MRIKRPLLKMSGEIFVLILAALTIVACGNKGISARLNDEKIIICHATGSTTGPYDEITVDFNDLTGHADHKDDLIPAPAAGCPAVVETDGNDGKIAICHATGSATNPYNEITIDFNGLSAHGNHAGDIIPSPEGGCPLVTPTPEITSTTATTVTPAATMVGSIDGKITICHATGSAKNPYVRITISVDGLSGHSKHMRDVIPASAGGCPKQ